MALGIIEIFLHAVPFILFLGGISTFYYAFQGVFTGRVKWWDDFGKRTEYDRNESPLKFWLTVIWYCVLAAGTLFLGYVLLGFESR